MNINSTSMITASGKRLDGPESFFSVFPDAWKLARSQVWKLELQQHYHEPESQSWQLAMAGDLHAAINEIPASRKVDLELYEDLRDRRIEFTRCHPIVIPKTKYIEWELEVYKYNEKFGERPYCCNFENISVFLKNFVHHDFMIFDSRLACIHDYDDSGRILGGWVIENTDSINYLLLIFSFVKSNSQHFSFFLDKQ